MSKNPKKYWSFISLVLIIAIFVSMFLWPAYTQILAWVGILISPGMLIAFSIRDHVQAHQLGVIDRRALVRNLTVDILGILITMLAVILVGAGVGKYASRTIGMASEHAWPGTGVTVGILAGILSAILAGLMMGLLMRRVMRYLARLKRPTSTSRNI